MLAEAALARQRALRDGTRRQDEKISTLANGSSLQDPTQGSHFQVFVWNWKFSSLKHIQVTEW